MRGFHIRAVLLATLQSACAREDLKTIAAMAVSRQAGISAGEASEDCLVQEFNRLFSIFRILSGLAWRLIGAWLRYDLIRATCSRLYPPKLSLFQRTIEQICLDCQQFLCFATSYYHRAIPCLMLFGVTVCSFVCAVQVTTGENLVTQGDSKADSSGWPSAVLVSSGFGAPGGFNPRFGRPGSVSFRFGRTTKARVPKRRVQELPNR